MAEPANPAPPPTPPPRSAVLTPALSSPSSPPLPETPQTSVPTPGTSRHPRRLDPHRLPAIKPVALGYDDMSKDDGLHAAFPMGPDELSPRTSPREAAQAAAGGGEDVEVEDDDGFPSAAELQRMQDAVDKVEAGDGNLSPKDLAQMLQSLLSACNTGVPFLRQQVTAQQATISAQQQQLALFKHMTDIERDRFVAERASWQAETQALIRTREAEVAAGNGPKRFLDLDVGYHQELENANKRLEMDNRLMAPRLVDTQQQIESLVTELRLLRTHVILNSSLFDADDEKSAAPSRPTKPARTTMGDARAEHLLLAAKKVRNMRQKDKGVGLLTLDELQRRGVVGPEGGVGYSEGYGGLDEEDELAESEEETKMSISPAFDRRSSTATKLSATPLLPRAKKGKRAVPTTPSRSRGAPQVPQTTPGGNFNDLLLAAEMATRPGTPSRSAGSALPSSRMSSAAHAMESPSKKPRRQAPATVAWSTTRRHLPQDGDGSPRRQTADDRAASALDLLAQASQDVAQGSGNGGVLASQARFEGMMEGEGRHGGRSPQGTPLGPAIDLEAAGDGRTPLATPSRPTADNPFINSSGSAVSAFQSPTGAAVPGLGKYVHLTSTVPARRVRSPYLKWTKEEDELLTRAVMEHGEKWDLVSKCVPTRSYHQVRQRWLRKTGAFDKKPTAPATDPSPLGRATPTEQGSPTPKGRKRPQGA